MIIYFVYYFAILFLTILVEILLSKRINKELKKNIYNMEKYVYNFYKEIILNKEKIYNFDKALDVLFLSRKDFFFWSHDKIEDYINFINSISEEKKYFYTLFGKTRLGENEVLILKSALEETYQLFFFRDILRKILLFLSLGLYRKTH